MQKIIPFLWFDNIAEEAMQFYTSVFKEAKAGRISYYPEGTPGPAGSVMTANFELFGQQFIALNGGPQFRFNESVSFLISCSSQEEIDYYWEKLSEGGEKSVCGWLKDKYGLSWQVAHHRVEEMTTKGGEATERMMKAMMKMDKLDIGQLEAAFQGNNQ